jgi:hypothetical protein
VAQQRRVSIGTGWAAVGLSAGLALGLLAGSAGVAGASNASKVAQAKKSLLKLSDLPKGWTSSSSGPHSTSNGAFPGTTQLAGCLGVATDVINPDSPTAYSPDFEIKSQEITVSDSVAVDRTAKGARADFDSLGNAKTPACLTSVLNGAAKSELAGELESGETLGTISVSRDPASDFAPHSATFTIHLPVTYQETVANTEITLVDYVKGDEEQLVTLTSINTTFPVSVSRHVTQVAAGRL